MPAVCRTDYQRGGYRMRGWSDPSASSRSTLQARGTDVAEAKSIRILSVEDHPVFRQGLATIIATENDMLLVGQASNAVEALDQFRRCRPDVTLMDLRLPGSNGTDALIAIRGEFPDARVVMLSSSESDGEIQRALRSGAAGTFSRACRNTNCSL